LLAYAGFSKLPLNVIVLNFFRFSAQPTPPCYQKSGKPLFLNGLPLFLSLTHPITDFK
jgi:hypothetical protein